MSGAKEVKKFPLLAAPFELSPSPHEALDTLAELRTSTDRISLQTKQFLLRHIRKALKASEAGSSEGHHNEEDRTKLQTFRSKAGEVVEACLPPPLAIIDALLDNRSSIPLEFVKNVVTTLKVIATERSDSVIARYHQEALRFLKTDTDGHAPRIIKELVDFIALDVSQRNFGFSEESSYFSREPLAKVSLYRDDATHERLLIFSLVREYSQKEICDYIKSRLIEDGIDGTEITVMLRRSEDAGTKFGNVIKTSLSTTGIEVEIGPKREIPLERYEHFPADIR